MIFGWPRLPDFFVAAWRPRRALARPGPFYWQGEKTLALLYNPFRLKVRGDVVSMEIDEGGLDAERKIMGDFGRGLELVGLGLQ